MPSTYVRSGKLSTGTLLTRSSRAGTCALPNSTNAASGSGTEIRLSLFTCFLISAFPCRLVLGLNRVSDRDRMRRKPPVGGFREPLAASRARPAGDALRPEQSGQGHRQHDRQPAVEITAAGSRRNAEPTPAGPRDRDHADQPALAGCGGHQPRNGAAGCNGLLTAQRRGIEKFLQIRLLSAKSCLVASGKPAKSPGTSKKGRPGEGAARSLGRKRPEGPRDRDAIAISYDAKLYGAPHKATRTLGASCA